MLQFHAQRDTIVKRAFVYPPGTTTTVEQTVRTEGEHTTAGYTHVCRLVKGDMAGLRRAIKRAADVYSELVVREKTIEIDNLWGGQTPLPADTNLEVFRYSGMLTSHVRDSVIYMWANGTTGTLPRQYRMGFEVIIQRARKPWDSMAWAQDQVLRQVIQNLALGVVTKTLDPAFIEAFITAQRYMLVRTFNWALEELNREWTESRFAEMNTAFKALLTFERDLALYDLRAGDRDTLLPFPILSDPEVQDLFRRDIIGGSVPYGQILPYKEANQFRPTEDKITMIRGARFTDGKFVILIRTNPQISRAVIPRPPQVAAQLHWQVRHSHLWYGPNTGVQASQGPTLNTPGRDIAPHTGEWAGVLDLAPGWTAITTEDAVPEPELRLIRKVCVITESVDHILLAADDIKPTLVEARFKGINPLAPPLVLPEMFSSVHIQPLITSAIKIEPSDKQASAKGSYIIASGELSSKAVQTVTSQFPGFNHRTVTDVTVRAGQRSELFGT